MSKHKRESHATLPLALEPKIQALGFPPLNSDGSNFLQWVNNAKTILNAQDLARTLITPVASTSARPDPTDNVSIVCKWQALHLLKRHLDQVLQLQYLEVEDPADLWAQLHSRYHHQQILYLPQARTDWIQLRVLDFPDFTTYNSEIHRIVSHLRLCGQEINDADLIEKTLSTFPPANAMLSQMYRNMKFKKHANLMAHLLMAEKNQQLLLRNAESRPVREVHTTTMHPAAAAPAPDTAVEAHVAQASRKPREVLIGNPIPHTPQERCEPMARVMCIRDIRGEMKHKEITTST